MTDTVVVALNHSQLAARAIPVARAIARYARSHVALVHATSAGENHLEVRLQELQSGLEKESIDADIVIRTGSPARTIADVAKERNARLIIMASHQRRGVDRWLEGSVTEQVLSMTWTPLLVVPAHAELDLEGGLRILIPLDGSQVGEGALRFVLQHSTVRPLEAVAHAFHRDAECHPVRTPAVAARNRPSVWCRPRAGVEPATGRTNITGAGYEH